MKASVLRLSEGKRGDLYNELAGAIRGVIDRHIATRDMSITVADAAGKGCHELSLVEDVSIEDSSSDSSAGDRVELTVVIKVRDQAIHASVTKGARAKEMRTRQMTAKRRQRMSRRRIRCCATCGKSASLPPHDSLSLRM